MQGPGGRPVQDLRAPDVFEQLQTLQLPGVARLHRVPRPRLSRNQGAEIKSERIFCPKKSFFILFEIILFKNYDCLPPVASPNKSQFFACSFIIN